MQNFYRPRHHLRSNLRGAAVKGAINLCDLTSGSFDVEKVTSHFVAFGGQVPRFRTVLQGVNDCVGDGSGISRGNKFAGNSFLDEVGETADICGDDRNSAKKGFDGGVGTFSE